MYTVKLKKTISLVKELATYDEEGTELTPMVMKTEEEVESEKQALIDEKVAELQQKVDKYEADKQKQLQEGGAGPVADFEIMKICNEHNGEFEVILEE